MSTTFLTVFLSTFCLSLILTRLCRSLATYFEVYDHTNERKIHSNSKPYLGGLAVFFSLFLPILFFTDSKLITFLFLGSLLVTSIGLVDDLFGLSGTFKIIGLAVAVLLVTPVDLTVDFFNQFAYGHLLNIGTTIFWVVLLASAMNAIDNMDGLAAGLALIASLMFFFIGAIQFPQPLWAIVSVAFAGSILGFLLFNFYPATIFLGDTGSLLIGFMLAMLSLIGNWSTHPLKSMIIPLVILIIPILDLVFIICYRFLTGKTNSIYESIEYSDQDHLSHRIQQVRNFGQRRTVTIMYILGLISGLTGIIIRNTHPMEATIALISVCLLYLLVIVLLLPNLNNIIWRW